MPGATLGLAPLEGKGAATRLTPTSLVYEAGPLPGQPLCLSLPELRGAEVIPRWCVWVCTFRNTRQGGLRIEPGEDAQGHSMQIPQGRETHHLAVPALQTGGHVRSSW